MISKGAIREFRNRSLDNFDWIKDYSPEELDQAINEQSGFDSIITTPFTHQKACFLLGTALKAFTFEIDMGLGKTKLILDMVRWFLDNSEVDRTLVIVPNVASTTTWVDQAAEHQPDLVVVDLGFAEERMARLKQDGDIYVINIAGLQAITTGLQPDPKNPKQRRREIVPAELNKIARMFDCVVFDEVHTFKNRQTLSFRIARAIAKTCKRRYGMTGTPFGRDPVDLWAEFYIVDQGETFGQTLGMFREAFCKTITNHWSGFDEYQFDPANQELLARMMRHRSIRYQEEECNDLPGLVHQVRPVELYRSVADYYNQQIKTLHGRTPTFSEIEGLFVRMRQITSGYLGGDPIIDFPHNAKLEALLELLAEVPDGHKAIVFHEFTHTGELIDDAIHECGSSSLRLWGGTKDAKGVIRDFNNKPDVRVLVANNKSGSVSLNLQRANYVIFYESPVSPIVRKQAIKRAYRTGQKHTVFCYDLVVQRSVDVRILEYLNEGSDLFDAVVNGTCLLSEL